MRLGALVRPKKHLRPSTFQNLPFRSFSGACATFSSLLEASGLKNVPTPPTFPNLGSESFSEAWKTFSLLQEASGRLKNVPVSLLLKFWLLKALKRPRKCSRPVLEALVRSERRFHPFTYRISTAGSFSEVWETFPLLHLSNFDCWKLLWGLRNVPAPPFFKLRLLKASVRPRKRFRPFWKLQ